MEKHKTYESERRIDKVPPGAIGRVSVTVTRGRGRSRHGPRLSTDDLGTVALRFDAPKDNRTGPRAIGYRITHVVGRLPSKRVLPGYDVRMRRGFLRLVWMDGATWKQEPVSFVVTIRPIDVAGNVGPPKRVRIRHPGR